MKIRPSLLNPLSLTLEVLENELKDLKVVLTEWGSGFKLRKMVPRHRSAVAYATAYLLCGLQSDRRNGPQGPKLSAQVCDQYVVCILVLWSHNAP